MDISGLNVTLSVNLICLFIRRTLRLLNHLSRDKDKEQQRNTKLFIPLNTVTGAERGRGEGCWCVCVCVCVCVYVCTCVRVFTARIVSPYIIVLWLNRVLNLIRTDQPGSDSCILNSGNQMKRTQTSSSSSLTDWDINDSTLKGPLLLLLHSVCFLQVHDQKKGTSICWDRERQRGVLCCQTYISDVITLKGIFCD